MLKNEKKFQLRPDAPAFKPSLSILERIGQSEDISKSDSTNTEVETELILFPTGKQTIYIILNII